MKSRFDRDRVVQTGARRDVPLQIIRDWEQGKHAPTEAAKALLKVLGQAPKIGLAAR